MLSVAFRLSAADPAAEAAAWARQRAAGVDVVPANECAPGAATAEGYAATGRAALAALERARAQGLRARPALPGPVSWLLAEGEDAVLRLPALLSVCVATLEAIAEAGAQDVRIDEPLLARDLSGLSRAGFWTAYDALAGVGPRLILAGGPGGLGAALDVALKLPVGGLHLDLARAPEQLDPALAGLRDGVKLSLGVAAAGMDAARAAALIDQAARALGAERLEVAPASTAEGGPAVERAAAALVRAATVRAAA